MRRPKAKVLNIAGWLAIGVLTAVVIAGPLWANANSSRDHTSELSALCDGLNSLRLADYGEWGFLLTLAPPHNQRDVDIRHAFIADLRQRYALQPCNDRKALRLPALAPGPIVATTTTVPTSSGPFDAEAHALAARCGTGFTITVARDGSVHGACTASP